MMAGASISSHPAPRKRSEISRDLDRLMQEARIGSVALLCGKLRDEIGNPDLADVIAAVERIYDADGEDHFNAAHRLRDVAEDICTDCGIEDLHRPASAPVPMFIHHPASGLAA